MRSRQSSSQVRKRELCGVDGDTSEIGDLSEVVGEAKEVVKGFDEAVRDSEAAASSKSFRCL